MSLRVNQDLLMSFTFNNDGLELIEVTCEGTKALFCKRLARSVSYETTIREQGKTAAAAAAAVAVPDPLRDIGSIAEQFELEHPTMQYFAYAHLPEHLRKITAPFHDLAVWLQLVAKTKPNPQLDSALHYLLLARDAAVRAAL